MNIARKKLNEMCRGRQKKEVAREIGVSPAFVGAVLRGRKRPGPKVLRYLGLEAYEAYRRVGGRRRASSPPTT